MLQVRAIRKFHDDKGILIGYTIKDEVTGQEMNVYKDQLKNAVNNVNKSYEIIEEKLGKQETKIFTYPYGLYTEEQVEALKNEGYIQNLTDNKINKSKNAGENGKSFLPHLRIVTHFSFNKTEFYEKETFFFCCSSYSLDVCCNG